MTFTFPDIRIGSQPGDETARAVCDIGDCRCGELAC